MAKSRIAAGKYQMNLKDLTVMKSKKGKEKRGTIRLEGHKNWPKRTLSGQRWNNLSKKN